MESTDLPTDLPTRIESVRRRAATPAYAGTLDPDLVDLEAWHHVGDPLAEALVGHLRAHRLMGGDLLATTRRLRGEGVAVADAFLTDVESVPGWLDFDALRPGAEMGLRCAVGMMLSIHGALPFTYVDPATARVMASTGRMTRGGDFRRRFWETASGFVGALDVDGMRPGGRGWEQWVRIRLLHTCIRMGILRSGRWDHTTGTPISQPPTAAGAHIFGRYRVNIIRHLGGRVSDEEAASFHLMWRWVARIEGASSELLGADSDDDLRITRRFGELLPAPDDDSRAATAATIDGLATMRTVFPFSRRGHAGIVRALIAPELTEILPPYDVAEALGLPADRRTDGVAAAVTAVGRGISRVLDVLPGTPDLDRRLTEGVVSRGLGRRPAIFAASAVAGDRG